MAKRIEERHALSAGKVDRSGPYPVVRGVLLCGPTSANRRRYRKEAFAGDRIKRYESRPVFLNHGSAREARQYQDKIATVENPRLRADGMPVGDLAVNPKHPYAEAFLFDAEHKPRSCGLSHVAQCETVTSKVDGWEEITEVVSVESVDLVTDPATTKGLHEGRKVPFTLKQLAESFPAKFPKATLAQRKFLLFLEDDMGLGAMDLSAEPPAEPADEGHEAAVDSAFTDAGCAIWKAFTTGEITIDEVTSKLKELARGHGKVQGTGKGDDDKGEKKDEPAEDKGGDEKKDDGPPKESKSVLPWDVLRECRAADYLPTPTALEMLAKENDPEKRKAFVAEQKALAADAAAQRPKSGARAPGASDTKTKHTAEAKEPANLKELREQYAN
jgi:hypothetical protein